MCTAQTLGWFNAAAARASREVTFDDQLIAVVAEAQVDKDRCQRFEQPGPKRLDAPPDIRLKDRLGRDQFLVEEPKI